MINWNPRANWTYYAFKNVVMQVLRTENKPSVNLDVKHSDQRNMGNIEKWAAELGYRAQKLNCDIVQISKQPPQMPSL